MLTYRFADKTLGQQTGTSGAPLTGEFCFLLGHTGFFFNKTCELHLLDVGNRGEEYPKEKKKNRRKISQLVYFLAQYFKACSCHPEGKLRESSGTRIALWWHDLLKWWNAWSLLTHTYLSSCWWDRMSSSTNVCQLGDGFWYRRYAELSWKSVTARHICNWEQWWVFILQGHLKCVQKSDKSCHCHSFQVMIILECWSSMSGFQELVCRL